MSGIVGSLNTRGSGLINIGSATDGQVFTGRGAGLPAGFEAVAAGGGWAFVSSQTASNDSSIDFSATGNIDTNTPIIINDSKGALLTQTDGFTLLAN